VEDLSDKTLRVTVEWEGKEFVFDGPPTDVSRQIQTFLMKTVPELSLAQELVLSVDARDLAEIMEGHVKITPEGHILVTVPEEYSSLSDRILCALIGQKFLFVTGRAETDYMPLSELASCAQGSSKSTSSRLSELKTDNLVERHREGRSVSYRATVRGILEFKNARAPKLE
jgi:hypothetical protein